jgi:flavodoxin
MKSVIVYWSRFGNGKKIVNYISKKFDEKKVENKIFKTDEVDPSNLPQADLYIFSTPNEAFNIQKNMRKFIKNLEGMDEKKYGIINTHGMKRNLLHKMERLLSKKNMKMIAGVDFQIGEGSQTGNGLRDGWESKVDEFINQLL